MADHCCRCMKNLPTVEWLPAFQYCSKECEDADCEEVSN